MEKKITKLIHPDGSIDNNEPWGNNIIHTDIISTINKDDTNKAIELINSADNATINMTNMGKTLLHRASVRGNKELCELLITKMNSKAINLKDPNGDTNLSLAIRHNPTHNELIEMFKKLEIKLIEKRVEHIENIESIKHPTHIKELINDLIDRMDELEFQIANKNYN